MHWMFLPLKRYVDFTGRSRRMEFWMWKLFQFLVGMAFTIILWVMAISVIMSGAGAAGSYGRRGDPGAALAAFGALGGVSLIITIIYIVWSLFVFLPDLAVTVRRLHDSNRTGWWVLAPTVPYLIGIFSFFAAGFGAATGVGRNGQLSDAGGAVLGGGIIIFFLCMLIALGLAVLLLVFFFLDGTNGPNRFGPDPKAGQRGYDQTFA